MKICPKCIEVQYDWMEYCPACGIRMPAIGLPEAKKTEQKLIKRFNTKK